MWFRYSFIFVFILYTAFSNAQIKGKVTNTNGEPLPYVNIYIKENFKGTTSNQNGFYELELEENGEKILVFQYLGYQTKEKKVHFKNTPKTLNVELKEASTSLEEVVVSAEKNPANRVIKNAIANRKKNLAKIDAYKANFYSRGLWKIENAPEKILGQEVGDLGGSLDSTRSGIVYLSETTSKIKFKAPNNFHETIIASKVSGNDNGFSLNSAKDANFSFYKNVIPVNADLVSPIADYAFNYYTYTLEGVFYDDNKHLINKIKVVPKRENDKVFSGHIYIVEDSWELYGIELSTTGKATQIPPINTLTFRQNFTFSKKYNFWVKLSQTVDFTWDIFGISGSGRFLAVYKDYNFNPNFEPNSFSKEILNFTENANKKDSVFWKNKRPIPLTQEESNDYIRKDSIQEIRNSKTYKDSVDRKRNKFKFTDVLFGYSYQNSFKKQAFRVEAPINTIRFNTVQGWNADLNASFINWEENQQRFWEIGGSVNYGLAEERLRGTLGFRRKFNNFSKAKLSLRGGVETRQINNTKPITAFVSTAASLLFDKNYYKIYERTFAQVAYEEEIFNGFRLHGKVTYQERKPLFNNQDIIEDEAEYTANNPLAPNEETLASFKKHNLVELNLRAEINFGQEYYTYPDGKYNALNKDYPKLLLQYKKGFAASEENYNYNFFSASLQQEISLQNKGNLRYYLNAGTFANAKKSAFLDYKHFKGNQTHLKLSEQVNQFNLMPYYKYSTNENYAQLHAEHNFRGYILNKIPLINKLNFNLFLSNHSLWLQNDKPYSEYSVGLSNIGIGKFRILRFEYALSYQDGWQDNGFMLGAFLSF
ncbi:DUF5686 and carboxypeptidase regulatory-like domain-containing protein [Haloflavibacter putidus]|uniref:Carboxypeptidase-like regulatory domain-containing protein n=1 Tax=Haloflavibacter putidus TaxID=2576776 RepID=A0A507ZS84_9FLAO|nr:DUF5686 and carboxypeptidase regulatory-like domain-containing protein [Haloflavibacter putidus]TQD39373.1 carboxypeptidase-like regulatory domain-containing protein [Haloflavibacter putidus]